VKGGELQEPPLTRIRALGVALLAAAFTAGTMAGLGFERGRVADAATPAVVCESGKRQRMTVDLVNPTPEQRQRIDKILNRRRSQLIEFLRDGGGRRLRSVLDSTRREVRSVLTPDQRGRYDAFVAEHRAHEERESGGQRPSTRPIATHRSDPRPGV
jgi:Spy/CpxP family protein refolding chaperone